MADGEGAGGRRVSIHRRRGYPGCPSVCRSLLACAGLVRWPALLSPPPPRSARGCCWWVAGSLVLLLCLALTIFVWLIGGTWDNTAHQTMTQHTDTHQRHRAFLVHVQASWRRTRDTLTAHKDNALEGND